MRTIEGVIFFRHQRDSSGGGDPWVTHEFSVCLFRRLVLRFTVKWAA